MKSLALALLAAMLLAFSLSPDVFANDMAILSCEVVENPNTGTASGRDEIKVSLLYFNTEKDGQITEKKGLAISCVEVLAKLVKEEKFEMQSVSSTNDASAYTLLRK